MNSICKKEKFYNIYNHKTIIQVIQYMLNNHLKQILIISIAVIGIMSLFACDKTKSEDLNNNTGKYKTITIKDIEDNGISSDIKYVNIEKAYPIHDVYDKVYEPSKDFDFPEGKETIDINEIEDSDIEAIYYPIVSEEEKQDFYFKRLGEGRSLKVKLIARQTNFDKRLIRDDSWYPYPDGISIKGKIGEVPEKILNNFKYWAESGEYEYPPLIVDENPILVDIEELQPYRIENDNSVKVGLLIDKNQNINTMEYEKGFKTAIEYIINNKYSTEKEKRYFEFLIKEIETKEEAVSSLNNLYEKENVTTAVFVGGGAMVNKIIPVAEKHNRLLFVDTVFDSVTLTKSDILFRISPSIHQRAVAMGGFLDESSKAILIRGNSNSDKKAYASLIKSMEEKDASGIVSIEIKDPENIPADFMNIIDKHIEKATHIVLCLNTGLDIDSDIAYKRILEKLLQKDYIKDGAVKIVCDYANINIFDNIDFNTDILISTGYHSKLVDNHLNDYLKQKTNSDVITYSMFSGFTVSNIVFELLSLKRTRGNYDIDNMRAFLTKSGDYITPKGFIKFREEDNEPLQSMYLMRLVGDGKTYTVKPYEDKLRLDEMETAPKIKK